MVDCELHFLTLVGLNSTARALSLLLETARNKNYGVGGNLNNLACTVVTVFSARFTTYFGPWRQDYKYCLSWLLQHKCNGQLVREPESTLHNNL